MSRTNIIVIVSSVCLFLFVFELVRRRQLREEYSWLWLLAAVSYLLLALWPDCAIWLARFFGSSNPISVSTFLGLFFLVLISIQFSIHISRLATRNKDLAQQLAILDGELRKLIHAVGIGNPDQSAEETDIAQRTDD
jgi:hypothetical protein